MNEPTQTTRILNSSIVKSQLRKSPLSWSRGVLKPEDLVKLRGREVRWVLGLCCFPSVSSMGLFSPGFYYLENADVEHLFVLK